MQRLSYVSKSFVDGLGTWLFNLGGIIFYATSQQGYGTRLFNDPEIKIAVQPATLEIGADLNRLMNIRDLIC